MLHEHFREALIACDVMVARKLWSHVMPNMPQPNDDAAALVMIHYARSLMGSIPFRLRAYSHAWLMERSHPSGLPDALRPSAQRMYPIVVGSVGIAIGGVSEIGRAIAPLVRDSMELAVMEAYADGHSDHPSVVRGRMFEARTTAIRKLLGR